MPGEIGPKKKRALKAATAPSIVNPGELPRTARQEAVALVYLRAVAAVAGFAFSIPSADYDSIDATILSRQGRRNGLDFQVKCTARELTRDSSDFPFRLSVKNYDDLRVDTLYPRLLLVVVVPKDCASWLHQDEERMHLRRCGYWQSLNGEPSKKVATVTVRMPRANVLTPSELSRLMGV